MVISAFCWIVLVLLLKCETIGCASSHNAGGGLLTEWEVYFIDKYVTLSSHQHRAPTTKIDTLSSQTQSSPNLIDREEERKVGLKRLREELLQQASSYSQLPIIAGNGTVITAPTQEMDSGASIPTMVNISSSANATHMIHEGKLHFQAIDDAIDLDRLYLPSLETPFFFFHIPKTGGTSLREYLFRDFLLRLLPLPHHVPLSLFLPKIQEAVLQTPVNCTGKNTTNIESIAATTVPSIVTDKHSALFSRFKEINSSIHTQQVTNRISSGTQEIHSDNLLLSSFLVKRTRHEATGSREGHNNRHGRHSHLRRENSVHSLHSKEEIRIPLQDDKHSRLLLSSSPVGEAGNMSVSLPLTTIPFEINDPRGSVLVPCENCECACDILKIANQASCSTSFLGHFYPYQIISQLHRIQSGIDMEQMACSRWKDLDATQYKKRLMQVQREGRDTKSMENMPLLTFHDDLFWKSINKSLCATVLRNPYSRAISGYYEFGYPTTNLSASEYIQAYGMDKFMHISSTDYNKQTAVLSGDPSRSVTDLDSLKAAKSLLEKCIVGVQEDFRGFVWALSKLFSIPAATRAKLKRFNSSKTKLSNLSQDRVAMNMTWFHEAASPYLSLDMELWQYAQYLAKRQKQLMLFRYKPT